MLKILEAFTRNFWHLFKITCFVLGLLVIITSISLIQMLSKIDLDSFSQDQDVEAREVPQSEALVEVDLEGIVYDSFSKDRSRGLRSLLRSRDKSAYISLEKLQKKVEDLRDLDPVQGVLFHLRPTFLIHPHHASKLLVTLKSLSRRKPVYFFAPVYSGSVNYLLGVGYKIALAPGGEVSLPSATMVNFLLGDLIDRIGIGVDLIKAGSYKSDEIFRSEMTEANRLHMQSVYASFLKSHKNMMAESRPQISQDTIDTWYRQVDFDDQRALNHQLITDVVHLEAFKKEIASFSSLPVMPWYHEDKIAWHKWREQSQPLPPEMTGKEGIQEQNTAQTQDSLQESFHRNDWEWKTLWQNSLSEEVFRDSLGYLNYSGTIMLDDQEYREDTIDDREVERDVDFMLAQNHVKAVVVRIHSPGGGVIASEMIWSHLKRLSEVKPVVAYVDRIAASGGYYMASAAQKIVISPMAITGSIGVLLIRGHMAGLSKHYRIQSEVFSSETYADIYDPTRELSDKTKKYLQDRVDRAYDLFLKRVARGRNLSPEEVHKKQAQGRIWTGEQAVKIQLVDAIGDRDKAFAIAKNLAGLDPDQSYPVIFPEKKIELS